MRQADVTWLIFSRFKLLNRQPFHIVFMLDENTIFLVVLASCCCNVKVTIVLPLSSNITIGNRCNKDTSSSYGNCNRSDSMLLNEPIDSLPKALIQQIVCKLVCIVLLYDITTKNRRGRQVIALDMPFFVSKDHQLFFIGKILVKENETPLCVRVSKSL